MPHRFFMNHIKKTFGFIKIICFEEKDHFLIVFCIFPNVLEMESFKWVLLGMFMKHIFDDIFLKSVKGGKYVWHKERLWFFRFPNTEREDEYTYYNYTTHSAKRTKYGDDIFLWDDITIETHTTESKSCKDFCFCERFSQISWKCESEDDRIDYESDHRERNTKYKGTRIREDTTTREMCSEITGHISQSIGIRREPELIRLIGQICCVCKCNKSEYEDNNILFHMKILKIIFWYRVSYWHIS